MKIDIPPLKGNEIAVVFLPISRRRLLPGVITPKSALVLLRTAPVGASRRARPWIDEFIARATAEDPEVSKLFWSSIHRRWCLSLTRPATMMMGSPVLFRRGMQDTQLPTGGHFDLTAPLSIGKLVSELTRVSLPDIVLGLNQLTEAVEGAWATEGTDVTAAARELIDGAPILDGEASPAWMDDAQASRRPYRSTSYLS